MNKLISLFIMDVTNSSEFKNGSELTNYLSFWENTLNEMNEFINIKAKHRMGDEIICVADNFYTAFLLASYITYNWKYKEHMPYFGLVFGEIKGEIQDIDSWNNPIVKKAREANDIIKQDSPRKTLMALKVPTEFDEIYASNINLLLEYQSKLILEQTEKQREILSLYSLINSQKKIAEIIGKSTATISSHYTKGSTEIIIKTTDTITTSLRLYQSKVLIDNMKQESIEVPPDFFKVVEEDLNKFKESLIQYLARKLVEV